MIDELYKFFIKNNYIYLDDEEIKVLDFEGIYDNWEDIFNLHKTYFTPISAKSPINHQHQKYQEIKEENLNWIRKLTKPVLCDLNKSISNVRGTAPTFGFAPVQFSPKESWYSKWSYISKDIIGKKAYSSSYIK